MLVRLCLSLTPRWMLWFEMKKKKRGDGNSDFHCLLSYTSWLDWSGVQFSVILGSAILSPPPGLERRH